MIPNPATGEVVEANPENATKMLVELRSLRWLVGNAIRFCEEIIAEESSRQGAKTLTIAGTKVEVTTDKQIVWDETVLHRLLDAGLPADRFEALMRPTVIYKVDTFEANRIAKANPEYAAIIAEARTDMPCRTRVTVK